MTKFNLKKKFASKKLSRKFYALITKSLNDYHTKNFSGHPEEQLELISGYIDMAKIVEAARERGFTVDKINVEGATEALTWWKHNTVHDVGSKKYNAGISHHQNMLNWAKAGLI